KLQTGCFSDAERRKSVAAESGRRSTAERDLRDDTLTASASCRRRCRTLLRSRPSSGRPLPQCDLDRVSKGEMSKTPALPHWWIEVRFHSHRLSCRMSLTL